VGDIAQAADWYDRQAPRLGGRFIEEVRRVTGFVSSFPRGYPVEHRSVRRAMLKHFPYFILYEVLHEELIVLAVFHQRQSPTRSIARLPN
jgi:plasmid stabilization system protein ParE